MAIDDSGTTLSQLRAVAVSGSVDLEALHLADYPVAPLLGCLFERGEPALMDELERLGVPRRAQRHALAGALASAVLRGELSEPGQLPIDYRHYASARMHPTAAEVLLGGCWTGGSEAELLAQLGCARPRADGLELMRCEGAIPAAGCAALRRVVDDDRSLERDSVDEMAEHQLNISKERLAELIGHAHAQRLFRLPDELVEKRRAAAEAAGAAAPEPVGDGGYYVDMFIRRYTRDTRPWIGFHTDVSNFTVNVALQADAEHAGGRLLAVLDGALQVVDRAEGEATVHDSQVMHAVSAMQRGVRYTLIVFFYELQPGPDAEEYRAVPTAPGGEVEEGSAEDAGGGGGGGDDDGGGGGGDDSGGGGGGACARTVEPAQVKPAANEAMAAALTASCQTAISDLQAQMAAFQSAHDVAAAVLRGKRA